MTVESLFHGIYIFTAIFGVGVTIVDMLGMLSGGSDGADHGHGVGDHSGHADGDNADHTEDADGHDQHGGHSVPILSVLQYLRILVYFSLGFGPAGLMAEATGAGLFGSLAWAASAGIVVTLLGRVFFRFQQKDVDSSVRTEDLFLGNASVIVPISGGNMGKVRVLIGQSVAERYALAEDAQDSFPTGAAVEIVRVTEECVYVRRPHVVRRDLNQTSGGI